MNELISIILVLLMATPRERVGNLARSSTVTHNPIPTHAPTNQTCALHTGASPPALLAQRLDLVPTINSWFREATRGVADREWGGPKRRCVCGV
jgi:hypothetical protein